MYQLRREEFGTTAEWDAALHAFDSWHLYQSGAWLDFLEETQPARRIIYSIRREWLKHHPNELA